MQWASRSTDRRNGPIDQYQRSVTPARTATKLLPRLGSHPEAIKTIAETARNWGLDGAASENRTPDNLITSPDEAISDDADEY